MFEIKISPENQVQLQGRFDAAQAEKAREIFAGIQHTVVVDFAKLEYISSAGLSVLLATQKRLKSQGQELVLKNLNRHIREIFRYAGFDMIFTIQ